MSFLPPLGLLGEAGLIEFTLLVTKRGITPTSTTTAYYVLCFSMIVGTTVDLLAGSSRTPVGGVSLFN
jgi:hypothetical protein